MTSLKTSIKTITYLSDTGCLEIQGASLNSSWKFYARMQKIDPALDVISGQVMSHILVDVYYE
ncbi:hypothetical protein VEE23_39700 [Escherichia coli]|nr:hypothetical protein VEE23_39700 [Escherichia coli]